MTTSTYIVLIVLQNTHGHPQKAFQILWCLVGGCQLEQNIGWADTCACYAIYLESDYTSKIIESYFEVLNLFATVVHEKIFKGRFRWKSWARNSHLLSAQIVHFWKKSLIKETSEKSSPFSLLLTALYLRVEISEQFNLMDFTQSNLEPLLL